MIKVEGFNVKEWKFPGGESGIKLERHKTTNTGQRVGVTCDFRSNDDLINLAQVKNALEAMDFHDVMLDIHYFPYARQDRVCAKGEANSLKVVANLINSLGFDRVTVKDPHSDVLPALLNRCFVITQAYAQASIVHRINPKNTILVAPDQGALKKTYDNAKCWGIDRVLTCFKQRDTTNGNIDSIKMLVDSDFKTDADFLVCDDILDGGRTFLELAPVLKKHTTGKIYLSVTHGIFSKGIEPFENSVYDKIFVSNMMNDSIDLNHKLLKV
jgi:ribose-phosphate pyrophosphokinase